MLVLNDKHKQKIKELVDEIRSQISIEKAVSEIADDALELSLEGMLYLIMVFTGKFPGYEGAKIQEKAVNLMLSKKVANPQRVGFFNHIENIVKETAKAVVAIPFGIFFLASMGWNDLHGHKEK